MNQIVNPFLPLNEYIPDDEPHVFGDRIYLYGSHDEEGGNTFCPLDYVCYSAPVSTLIKGLNGVYPLFIQYRGKSKIDFLDFEFINDRYKEEKQK